MSSILKRIGASNTGNANTDGLGSGFNIIAADSLTWCAEHDGKLSYKALAGFPQEIFISNAEQYWQFLHVGFGSTCQADIGSSYTEVMNILGSGYITTIVSPCECTGVKITIDGVITEYAALSTKHKRVIAGCLVEEANIEYNKAPSANAALAMGSPALRFNSSAKVEFKTAGTSDYKKKAAVFYLREVV